MCLLYAPSIYESIIVKIKKIAPFELNHLKLFDWNEIEQSI
mgnify:CR=1 FL=1